MIPIPQVERRSLGYIQQQCVFLLAFDSRVSPRKGRIEIVGDVFVEFLVLLLRDLALWARPQRRSLIDLLLFVEGLVLALVLIPFFLAHEDRNGDVIGVLADDACQLLPGEQLILAFAQVQDNVGAAPGLVDALQGVVALTVAFPPHTVLATHAGSAGDQRYLVGYDERRVEAHPELADQIGVLGLVARELLKKLARTRLRDGADVV